MRQRWAGTATAKASIVAALATLAAVALLSPALASADPDRSDWSPHMDFWPYNTFTYQVTPEMISGMAEACQWFDAQFDPLLGQINDFNHTLADRRDVYAGVQSQAEALVTEIDRSTGFLAPRLQPLTIRNTPDNYGPYSPIYGGEQLTGVLFQLSRIADSIRGKQPAGFTRPHIDSAAGWGRALRNSGACS